MGFFMIPCFKLTLVSNALTDAQNLSYSIIWTDIADVELINLAYYDNKSDSAHVH